MPQTEKSFVQVASNSLTLDDISELIAKAKADLSIEESSPAESAALEPTFVEPEIVEPAAKSSGDQQLTENEIYNQTLSEASQARPTV